ncbi:MAG: hypothetical protein OEZ22_08335, partial [Spirochaetia bacterium]|nr:hypothetical protein [Spirochaetia bacterium]
DKNIDDTEEQNETDEIVLKEDSSDDFFKDEPEEPISLSDDELGNILTETIDEEPEPAKQEIIKEPKTTSDETSIEDKNIDDTEEQNETDEIVLKEDSSDDFFKDEPEEPISLSDDELDNILTETADEEITLPEQEAVEKLQITQEEQPIQDILAEEMDGSISFSDSELNDVLAESEKEIETEETVFDADHKHSPQIYPILEDDVSTKEESQEKPDIITKDLFEKSSKENIALSVPLEMKSNHEEEEEEEEEEISDTIDFKPPESLTAEDEGEAEDEIIIDFEKETAEVEAFDTSTSQVDASITATDETEPFAADDTKEPPLQAINSDETDEMPIAFSESEQIVDAASDAKDVKTDIIQSDEKSLTEESIKTEPIIKDSEGNIDLQKDSQEYEKIPDREDLRNIISYLDVLLGELPENTIKQFAESDYFKVYQKVMDELGL